MRSLVSLLGVSVALAGCAGRAAQPAAFNPDDPTVIAAIDSLLQGSIIAARNVDADGVLRIAEGPEQFTFVTGDVMLAGLEPIRASFQHTYSSIAAQHQEVESHRVRLVAPDVAIYSGVGEGTYTDKAGWTSPPVGIGLTVVFVRKDGKWQAVHAHQSIAP